MVTSQGEFGAPIIRVAEEDELVPLDAFGFDGVYVKGRGFEVAEWGDGMRTAMLSKPQLEFTAAAFFLELAVCRKPPRGAEGRFMRRHIGLTLREVAAEIGRDYKTLIRYEKAETLELAVSRAIQHFMQHRIHTVVSTWNEALRELNREALEQL